MNRWHTVVFLVMVAVVVGTAVALLVDHFSKRAWWNRLGSDFVFKNEVIKRLASERDARRSDRISAAVLAAERAAVLDLLLDQEAGRSRQRPSEDERAALDAFDRAGHEDVYIAFLKLKYPAWSPAASEKDAQPPDD
jgi:outer membrane murein-binding lipoprotein Lpp